MRICIVESYGSGVHHWTMNIGTFAKDSERNYRRLQAQLTQLDKAVWLKLDEIEFGAEAKKSRIWEITNTQVLIQNKSTFRVSTIAFALHSPICMIFL